MDEDESKKRTFRFDRIKNIEITERKSVFAYDVGELSEISNVWALSESGDRIYIEMKAYKWAYDFFKNFEVLREQTVRDKGEYLLVKGTVSSIYEILPYVMKFAPCVEIIKGRKVLEEASKRMKEFLNRHRDK